MGQYDTKIILENVIIFTIQMGKYSPNLLSNVISNGREIIQTMQNRKDKKLMYVALTNVIHLKYLSLWFSILPQEM